MLSPLLVLPQRITPAGLAAASLFGVMASLLLAACSAEPTPTPTALPTAALTPIASPTSTPVTGQTVAHTPRAIDLPADEAPHSDPVEWWYYSGVLDGEDDKEYGFHFVIFQVTSQETGDAGYMSHASVYDVADGLREQSVRFETGAQEQPASGGFNFAMSDWELSGNDGVHSFAASTDSFTFDLTVEANKPAAFQNTNGYLEALNGWTYYYSWTNMDVTGTLSVNGETQDVTGRAWMDHQWGDFVVGGYPSGWQWFAVSLDTDYELMVAESREANGQIITYATLVDPAGATTHIDGSDITIDVLDTWLSPHTDGEYPSGWQIDIPAHEMSITLTPMLADQEFTLAFPPNTIYWEGLVATDITFRGEAVDGSAYVELVGFSKLHIPQESGS